MNHLKAYVDGDHFVFPDGRRLLRVRGGENNQGGAPAAFDPGAAPAAQQVANEGAQQQGPQGAPAQQQQAPAGADPRVIEQMQQQMQQFGQVIGPMAEALPALQQFAQTQQQQQQGPPEPSLDEMAAMFFGGQQQQAQPGMPGMPPPPMVPDPYAQGVQYDAYGNPVGYDPYAQGPPQQPGIPPQLQGQYQQFQQQQAQQGQPADPSQFVDFLRRVVREEVSPLQEGFGSLQQQRQQEAWNSLYQEIPAMKDPQQAPQIAQRVAQAAYMFGRNDEEAQRLARDPGFARMVHLSSQTEAQAQGETPAGAGDGVTAVESGSGASALGQGEIDPGDAIVGAGRTAGAPASIFAGGR